VLTVHYSGFQDGDDTNILQGAPTVSTLANTNSPVGTYPIAVTLGSLSASNYGFCFSNGVLSVTQAPLTVQANNQTRNYGSTNPALTLSYSGFVNGQDTSFLQTLPLAATLADTNSHVGSYAITVTGGNDTNYSFNLMGGTLQVLPAPLTATAWSLSRAYGATNPTLGLSYVGFVNGQDPSILTSSPIASTVATVSSPVGSYDIILSGGSAGDYNLTLVNGTLTITQATLTITANNQTRLYGATNPMLTISYAGFVNGENASALTSPPWLSTSATPASAVGSYAIVVHAGADANYQIMRVNGTLSVTPAALTVTANGATRAYGTTNPVFTGTIVGLLNNDPITATYATVAGPNSPAGIYSIVPTLVDPDTLAGNYLVTLVNASLNITAALTLTATPGNYVVGQDAVPVDTNALVADGNSLNFAGGSLLVTSLTNGSPADDLEFQEVGTNAGQIALQGATITYGGQPFATFTATPSNLSVTLGSNPVTSVMLTALLEQLTFATDDTNTASRLIQVALNYGSNSVTASRALLLDRPPVAEVLNLLAAKYVNFTVPYSAFLTNATDPDGDPVTLAGMSLVSGNGNRITTNATTFTYHWSTNFTGNEDVVAYVLSDGRGGQTVGLINVQFVLTNQIVINASNLSTAGVQLSMGGTPGRVYQVQDSTDLTHWALLQTVTATPTGIILVLDTNALNYPYRFYRAIGE
jgi:hypothetical protein